MIRKATIADANQICDIYNYYVLNTTVSFEESAVTAAEMAERITAVITTLPWIVYEKNGIIIGYAYASKWRARSAYRFSVESSVYMRHDQKGKGIGTILYRSLIDQLKIQGVHTVIGGVAESNPASSKLHEKFGFEKVATFKEVGFKNDQWLETSYWQLIL